ncbi:hypothetical protein BH09PLA1_BH09PLA1_32790 [soil metagenome]
MPSLRTARLRAAIARVDLLSKSSSLSVEPLEQRVLMCATVAELVANGVPASMVHDDGHILRSDFETLSAKVQAHVDPHWVEADPVVVDYDKLYGKPLFMSEAAAHEAQARGGPNAAVDALPDFFPSIPSGDGPSVTTTLQPGRALMRFGTQVNNQGAGPGSLISADPGAPIPTGAPISSWVNPDGSQNVLQPVFNYTGSSFVLSYYRAAGKMIYHPGHGHLHYDGYASYKLRARNGDGTPGAYIERSDGSGVVGAKVGFCLLTFSGTFTTEAGGNSSLLPGYNQDTNAPSSCGYQQGIRVGHYDQYSSGLTGQWIDVTGVPNGQYFLEIQLDASNAMAESNDANNAKTFAVTLNVNPPSGGITPDVYDTNGQNDTPATATDMGALGVFTKTGLNIDWGQDKDYFEFTATSSTTGTITTTSTGGDVDLYLYDSAGNELRQSALPTGSDSVSWNFTAGEEYYIKVHTYNSTTSSNYQIAWNIKPTVAYAATDSVASELGSNTGNFRIDRNGPTTGPLIIDLLIEGTATRGVDYTLSSPDGNLVGNQLTVGTLASSVNIIVTPIKDNIREDQETVILSIASATAYVSTGGTQTITIDDKPRRQVFPGGPSLPPGTLGTGVFNDHPLLDNHDGERLSFDDQFASI